MMKIVLILLPLLCGFAPSGDESGTVITDVRSLTGGYYRLGCWHPLEVVVRSAKGFEGTLVVDGIGSRVAIPVVVPPGREATIATVGLTSGVLHEIRVRLVRGDEEVAERLYQGKLTLVGDRDRLIGVPEEAWPVPADGAWFQGEKEIRLHYFPFPDRLLIGRTELFLDGVDGLVVGANGADARRLSGWRLRGGSIVPLTIAARHPVPARLTTVAGTVPSFGSIADRKWFEPRRENGLIAILLFFFVAFLLFVYLAMRRVRRGLFASVAVVLAALFSLGVVFLGGTGDLAVEVSDLLLCAGDEAYDTRLFTVRSDRTGEYAFEFDDPAKPLFPERRASGPPITVLLREDGGSSISRVTLARGATMAFVAGRSVVAPGIAIGENGKGAIVNKGTIPVYGLFAFRASGAARVGDLAPGAEATLEATPTADHRLPPAIRFLRACVGRGYVAGEIRPDRFFGAGISSPDLTARYPGRTMVLYQLP